MRRKKITLELTLLEAQTMWEILKAGTESAKDLEKICPTSTSWRAALRGMNKVLRALPNQFQE